MGVGVPSVDRVLVVLVHRQPLLTLPRAAPADQREPSAQLVAEEVHMELALLQRGSRVLGPVRAPGAGVPHRDVTGAIVPGAG
jgi:hypothetical protein